MNIMNEGQAPDPDDLVEFERVTLSKLQFENRQVIPGLKQINTELELSAEFDYFLKNIVVTIRTDIWSEILQDTTQAVDFKYPASWWQYFKHQYFPDCLKRTFPVKYKTETKSIRFVRYACYPSIPSHQHEPVIKEFMHTEF